MIVFFEKSDPLTGKKIQNFATKGFMRTMIQVKKWKWPNRCVVFITKKG